MTELSPRLGLTIPTDDGSDSAVLDDLLRALGLDIENKAPGVTALTTAARTALTGAAMFTGRVVYDTTDSYLYLGDGTTWRALARLDTSGNLPMAGKKVTGLADGTAAADAATKGQLDVAMPVGAVVQYAGSAAPSGWALCNGAAISRSTYAALFAAIGTAHGTGDGSTTFNLPDLRGRFVLGAGSGPGLTPRTIADKNGNTETHTLTISEMPSHGHGGNTNSGGAHDHTYSGTTQPNGNHDHGGGFRTGTWYYYAGSGGSTAYRILGFPSDLSIGGSGNHDHTYSGTSSRHDGHAHGINNDGGGGAHNNMPPYYTLTYIIKTA